MQLPEGDAPPRRKGDAPPSRSSPEAAAGERLRLSPRSPRGSALASSVGLRDTGSHTHTATQTPTQTVDRTTSTPKPEPETPSRDVVVLDLAATFQGVSRVSGAAAVVVLGLVILLVVALSTGWNQLEEVVVKQGEYVTVRNAVTGERRVINTPGEFELSDDETVESTASAIVLTDEQYIIVTDEGSGERVAVHGPQVYLPCTSCADEVAGAVLPCSTVTAESALLVSSTQSGGLRLVTDLGTFCPAADDNIVGSQSSIQLSENQSMVLQTTAGALVRSGSDSFFVPPNATVHTFTWSVGPTLSEGQKDLSIVDLRPQRLTFDYGGVSFEDGTFRIAGVIFWQVVDLGKLVGATADPPGDLWLRLRSRIVLAAVQAPIHESTNITAAVLASEVADADEFYADRGVALLSMELSGTVTCIAAVATAGGVANGCADVAGEDGVLVAGSVVMLSIGIICVVATCVWCAFCPPAGGASGPPPPPGGILSGPPPPVTTATANAARKDWTLKVTCTATVASSATAATTAGVAIDCASDGFPAGSVVMLSIGMICIVGTCVWCAFSPAIGPSGGDCNGCEEMHEGLEQQLTDKEERLKDARRSLRTTQDELAAAYFAF